MAVGGEAAGGALATSRLLAALAAAARRGVRPDPAARALAEHALGELREASGELAAARFTSDLFRRIQRLVDRRASLARTAARSRLRLAPARPRERALPAHARAVVARIRPHG